MDDGRAGCKQLGTDVTALQAMMPSPFADLTQELQAVITNYTKAAAMCETFDETTPDEYIQEARRYLNAGSEHFQAAVRILKTRAGMS